MKKCIEQNTMQTECYSARASLYHAGFKLAVEKTRGIVRANSVSNKFHTTLFELIAKSLNSCTSYYFRKQFIPSWKTQKALNENNVTQRHLWLTRSMCLKKFVRSLLILTVRICVSQHFQMYERSLTEV